MSDDKSKGWLPCRYGREVACGADADPAGAAVDARLEPGAEEGFGGGAAADAEETPCRCGFGGARLFVRGLERPMARSEREVGEMEVEGGESKLRCDGRRQEGMKAEK